MRGSLGTCALVAVIVAGSGINVVTAAAGGPAALIAALKAGDVSAARQLLDRRVDPNAAEPDGTTALHWAVELDDLALVDALIDAGADAKATNRYGIPTLWVASTNRDGAITRRLLEAGASPNTILRDGETILMAAARTGNVAIIDSLLAAGADADARETALGQTALMFAAAENHPAAIRRLVAAGADITVRSGDEASARAIVAANRSLARYSPFTRRGAIGSITATTGRLTPLLIASRNGSLEAVRTLIELGAEVNEASAEGRSALVFALINAHFELASILIDAGANLNATGAGFSALHQLVQTRNPNMGFVAPPPKTGRLSSLDIAKKLVARGADVNIRMTQDFQDGHRSRLNRVGATPFLLAAKAVDVEMMEFLLEHAADPSIPTEDGTTPLMVAAGAYMFNPGEDAGTGPGTEAQAQAAVKRLLDLRADVLATDKNGETALHGVAYRGDNTIAQWLIERGAKLDAKNAVEWTPLTIADGVNFTGFLKQQRHTALFLRQEMKARGMPVDEHHVVNADQFTQPKKPQ